MPNLPRLAQLDDLRRALGTAVRVTGKLARTGALAPLVSQDPERWNPVLDSLSAAMEPGELGSVQQTYTALSAALED